LLVLRFERGSNASRDRKHDKKDYKFRDANSREEVGNASATPMATIVFIVRRGEKARPRRAAAANWSTTIVHLLTTHLCVDTKAAGPLIAD
jgi:hypothetical protein